MKKTILSLALCLVAGVAGAQTLTKVWETTKVLPVANARYATGSNGKIYAVDFTNKILYSWDAEGAEKTQVVAEIGGGYACTADNFGRIWTNTSQWGAGALGWQVYDLAKAEKKAVTIDEATLPTGFTKGAIGLGVYVEGDCLSSDGGYLYLGPDKQTKAAKLSLHEGQHFPDDSKVIVEIPAPTEGATQEAFSVEAQVAPYGESMIWRHRSNGILAVEAGALASKLQPEGKVSNTGFALFKLGGVEYGVVPSDKYRGDGFTVYTFADGKAVASRANTIAEEVLTDLDTNNKTQVYASLRAEVVSETKANIYFYRAGLSAGVYTFEVPAGNPSALDNVATENVEVRKVVENGQVYIIRDGVKYNILGGIAK